jgi:carboxyl-terminal processing protease
MIDLNQWLRKNDLGDMGALKLTTQKFYRVNGGSTQLEGVKSDVVMPDRYSYIDVGERDYDNPLPYDKIDAAKYEVWDGYIDFQETIDKSKVRMAQSEQLKLIDEQAHYIKARRDEMEVNLNFEAYRAEIGKRKEETKKFDSIDSYDNKLSYRSLSNEIEMMKQDTTLREKRKRWHKSLSKDIYVEEAIHVLEDLKLNNIKAGKVANIKN